MHPKWEASGHVENFTDPMIDCKQCKSRFRIDVLSESLNEKKKKKAVEALQNNIINNAQLSHKFEAIISKAKEGSNVDDSFDAILEDAELGKILLTEITCPQCGNKNTFTSARQFNLMFKTFIGPVEDSGAVIYLRPETAQGIYVNFLNVQGSSRQKIPFGIAQLGKLQCNKY
jgi:glycyl-tRNA synthetase